MATKKDLATDSKLFTPLSKWSEADKLKLCKEIFGFWQNATRNVHENYVRFSRLYMNQYKSDSNLLGSKLLFTKHNDTMAMLRSETKNIDFYPRKDSDKEAVDNLKDVRNYDEEEMEWNKVSRVWDNDASFYGLGILNLVGFNKERGTMIAKNVNPFLAIYDVYASSRSTARFGGEICYMTANDLMTSFDPKKIQKALSSNAVPKRIGMDENTLMVDRVREYTTGLQNTQTDINNALAYFQIIDLHINHAGEMYRIVSDLNFNAILDEYACDYEDGVKNEKTGKKSSLVPYEYKSLYQLPNSIQGLGVAHIVEDDHRVDVQLTNYMLEGVKQDATPRMLYKNDGLVNPRDLRYATSNRNIATKDIPSNVMMPFPKTNVATAETMSFLSMIQQRSDGALGSSRIMRASISEAKKTATEIAVAKAKQDELIADRVKDMVEAEKRVWKTYVARLRKYFPDAESKNIRIIGKTGEAKMKKLAKLDFVPQTDPDVIIDSKLLAEPMRVIARNELVNTLPYIQQTGGSVKNTLKKIYRLSDMKETEINMLIPPTPDEMRASMENEQINREVSPMIDEMDNDMEHLAVHQMADDNTANERHRLGHMLNYLRKAKEAKAQKEQAQNVPPQGIQAPQQDGQVKSDSMAGVDQLTSTIMQ